MYVILSTIMTKPFLYEIPKVYRDVSSVTNSALQLAALSARLALENRTLCEHKTGRAENVAEHSNMLALVAPAIAEQYFEELDSNLIARFATIHDAVEAYVGDTPTHEITVEGLDSKQVLEKSGLDQLKKEYAGLPLFAQLIDDYEAQQIPEARFVRVVDKWMPLLVHFQQGGSVLAWHYDREGLMANSDMRCAQLRQEYPEFNSLIDVREELAVLAAKELLTK